MATLPFRLDAGYDLFSGETVSVAPESVKLVDTFVTATIPIDCYARVAPRSSLALKFIDVGVGVIDADYIGTVRVVIYNFSADIFSIDAGDRTAQLIIERIFIVVVLLPLFEVMGVLGPLGSKGLVAFSTCIVFRNVYDTYFCIFTPLFFVAG